MSDSSIITKIKALLAKAASTTNANEAAAFAAKANELMEKYQIDVDAIRNGDDPVGRDRSYEGKSGGWRQSLAGATGRYYGCRAVRTTLPDGTHTLEIFGRESARVTAMLMFPYFQKTVLAMSREMAKLTGMNKQACSKQIGLELAVRLRELAPKMEADDLNPEVKGKNALIRLDEVNQAVEAAFPKLRKARRSSFTTTNMARDYANSISLAGQVNGASRRAIGSR